MKSVFDFLFAALPWISIGLPLALFCARGRKKRAQNEQTDNYGPEGMCLGMCFGTAIGTSLGNNTGLGISLGMLLGLAIGSGIRKEKHGDGGKQGGPDPGKHINR